MTFAYQLMLDALNAAKSVFDEMDDVKWPKGEYEEFYGEPGRCPVDYDGAQAKVIAALDAIKGQHERYNRVGQATGWSAAGDDIRGGS